MKWKSFDYRTILDIIIIGLLLFIALRCWSQGTAQQHAPLVTTVNGLDVYVYCQPAKPCKFLGYFFYTNVSGNVYAAIDSVKHQYPTATGVIFKSTDFSIGSAIKK